MGAKTGIEWTDSTWSPIRVRVRADAAAIARAKGYTSLLAIAERMATRVGQHCEHVSPGCAHCYAGTMQARCLSANGTGLPYDRRSRDLVEPFIDERILLQPLKWGAVVNGCLTGRELPHAGRGHCPSCSERSRRIFVENQSDLFGEWVPDELLDQVFAVMALCPQHIFQVLTKRPARMRAYFTGDRATLYERWLRCSGTIEPQCRTAGSQLLERLSERTRPLENIWLGVSVENQAAADERIPLLLQTPAAVRFLSCEPLLGPVNVERYLYMTCRKWDTDPINPDACDGPNCPGRRIDWVICGGESGPGARPMHPDWARGLRDRCQAAGVPFFFKQWGAWAPDKDADIDYPSLCFDDYTLMWRLGKKEAGALLDGHEWEQFPRVRA